MWLAIPIILLTASPASAHQPRIVGYAAHNQILDRETSLNNEKLIYRLFKCGKLNACADSS